MRSKEERNNGLTNLKLSINWFKHDRKQVMQLPQRNTARWIAFKDVSALNGSLSKDQWPKQETHHLATRANG